MVNVNGLLQPESQDVLHNNRAFLYGDGVFETIKVAHGKVLFLEDHYFRLMATMRIVRMKIPVTFTMEFFESELLKTVAANSCTDAARVRCTDCKGFLVILDLKDLLVRLDLVVMMESLDLKD
jgi:branched-chain amino acid aminotransferase